MRKFSILTIFAFLVLPIMSCNAQNKDNPAVAIVFPPKVSTYYGADKMKFIKEATSIEAYHLKSSVIDTTSNALWGFKVIKKIPRLSPSHSDSLLKILADSSVYSYNTSAKRCGLPADLAFKFVKGNEHLIIFIALDCDVIYSTLNSAPKANLQQNPPAKMNDFENGHNKVLSLAKQLFPNEYRNVPFLQQENIVVNNQTTPVVVDSLTTAIIRSGNTHKVVKGETIKSIAKKYSIKEADLLKWNKISDKSFAEGMELIVSNPNAHTVKKGESLKDIANAYSCKEEDLIKWNKLKSKEIKEGDILIIRNEK